MVPEKKSQQALALFDNLWTLKNKILSLFHRRWRRDHKRDPLWPLIVCPSKFPFTGEGLCGGGFH